MALQSKKAGPSKSTLSSNHDGFEYDVFLSFRGEDTRHNFAGLFHLFLELKGIRAYFDEEDLPKGQRIEEILEAISRSKILVPIFSEKYAESHWCLKEVAKMFECYDGGKERHIIPVFFDVDSKDVRYQSGPFKAAFEKHQTDGREVEGWKQALRYVGGISGYDLKTYNGDQRKLSTSIIAAIQDILATMMPLYEEEYLVGLESRMKKMMKHLDFQAKDVRIIGIHGISGVGKTTLAKAIYNRNRHLFQASSFIENVREVSKSKGLDELQQQLIRDISKDKHKKDVNNSSKLVEMIRQTVGIRSVLLVLDDVDDQEQLVGLAGDKSWFHLGSRIIITTRHEAILKDEAIYRLQELDEKESLLLFQHHAFKGDKTPEEYLELSKEIVPISNGLPLVLEAFGSHFKTAETPQEWNKLLEELRRRQHCKKVHEQLRICYDGLEDNEKLIFLDIACLLVRKNVEDAIYMWEGHDYLSPNLAIISLQNKCLIKINKGKFEMHDQIREMGREIVRTESLLHPEKCSRLWREVDIVKALTKSTKSREVQGIILRERSKTKSSTQAFKFMSELRVLLLNIAIFDKSDFGHFPASLKWLEWEKCPLKTLPLDVKFKSIVVLNLSGSSISQLWSKTMTWTGPSSISSKTTFDGLKVLDLSCCHCLYATPNFGMSPNLKRLIFDECSKLKEVDDSIESLKELVYLSMRGCVSLKRLPNKIYELSSLEVFNLEGCRSLVAFPQFSPTNSTNGLAKLKKLILRDCASLKSLPDLEKFKSLRSLHVDGLFDVIQYSTGLDERIANLMSGRERGWTIEELIIVTLIYEHRDFTRLLPKVFDKMKVLDLSDCKFLFKTHDFAHTPHLEKLILDHCERLVEIGESIGQLKNLILLSIVGCGSLCHLPNSIGSLVALEELNVAGCGQLRRIPGLQNLRSLKVLLTHGCPNLCLASIRFELEKGAFHDLEAFSISSLRCKDDFMAISLRLPIVLVGRTPLLVQKINVLGRREIYEERVKLKIEVVRGSVHTQDKDFYSLQKLFSPPFTASFQNGEGALEGNFTASFQNDDEINKRLREFVDDDATRFGTLRISCERPCWLERADIWFGRSPTPVVAD